MVNKSTTVNRFVLHTLQRNITLLAVITRITNIKLGILKGGTGKESKFHCIMTTLNKFFKFEFERGEPEKCQYLSCLGRGQLIIFFGRAQSKHSLLGSKSFGRARSKHTKFWSRRSNKKVSTPSRFVHQANLHCFVAMLKNYLKNENKRWRKEKRALFHFSHTF